MLSEMAKNDLIALRQQGFKPTDEEIVALNDIAVRLEHGKETTPANAPRVAFAGNVVFHEPTLGALEWWYGFGSSAAYSTKWRIYTYFFMLANAKNLDYLDKLESAKDINKAVQKWMKGVNATENELWRALWYVKFGERGVDIGDTDGEEPTSDESRDKIWDTICMAAGLFGVPPDSLRTYTQSTVLSCIEKSAPRTHAVLKKSVAEDYIRYKKSLREIEQRG